MAAEAAKYQGLRVLMVRENWLGCTGLSAFNAFLRAGCWADSISEIDYAPQLGRSVPLKILARLLEPLAVREFNRVLLAKTHSMRPDLFFCVKGPWVLPETLRAMETMGVRRYCFYPDVSLMTHGRYLPKALPEYDWVFTTKSFGGQDLQQKLGVSHSSYLPHAYDPNVHRPRPLTLSARELFECDLSFIGGWSLKKERILEAIATRRPHLKLKIWGDRWQEMRPDSPLRQAVQFRSIVGVGYATAISCSKINLGLVHERVEGASQGDQITSRTFHIPASGGLMLHERTTDLLAIFTEDKHCVCFDSIDELVEKIDDLLTHETKRQAIAAQGYELVTGAHSWDHRVRHILEHYCQPLKQGEKKEAVNNEE